MAFLTQKNYRKLDITILAFSPLIAGIISNAFNLNFFISTIMFLGLPSFYLSFRTKTAVLRSFIFTSLLVIPTVFIDHLAVLDKSWYVPHTIFPFRILGTVPIEDVEVGFLLTYLVVIFYEHFFDKGKHKILESYARFAPYILISLALIVSFLVSTGTPLLKINYFYLKVGLLIGLIPAVAFLIKFPKYISIFIKTVPYFFYLVLLEELTGLRLGHWIFPGQHYIGWLEVMKYKFPMEEFLFWILLFSTSIISYFEFFDDAKLRSKKR